MYRILLLIAILLLLPGCGVSESVRIISSYEIWVDEFEYWIEKDDGTLITEKKAVDELLKAKGVRILSPMTFEIFLSSSYLDRPDSLEHVQNHIFLEIDMSDGCQHGRDTISLMGVKVQSNCLKKNEEWCGRWQASTINKGIDPCSSQVQRKVSKRNGINGTNLPIIVPDSLFEPNRELDLSLDVATISKASSIRKLYCSYDIKVNDIIIHIHTKIRRSLFFGITGRP